MKTAGPVILAAVFACQPSALTPRMSRLAPVVQLWVTTGDQTKLLQRQPDVHLGTPASGVPSGVPAIDVDESKTYQQMIGFGAAMTDASAYLISTRCRRRIAKRCYRISSAATVESG